MEETQIGSQEATHSEKNILPLAELYPIHSRYGFESLLDANQKDYPQISWLVEGLIPCEGLSILAARAKVGKSTLLRQLTSCVASGRDFLGRSTQQGKVFIVTLEDRLGEVLRHLNDLGTPEENVFIRGDTFKDKNEFRSFLDELTPGVCDLLILDPLVKAVSLRDINDYAKTYEDLAPLLEAAKKSKAHIMLTHHLNKGKDVDEQGGILGSTALSGIPEQMFFMKSVNRQRMLSSTVRYGDQIDNLPLDFDPTTKEFSVAIDLKLESDVGRNPISSIESKIMHYLERRGDWATRDDIRKNIGGKTSGLYDALARLEDALDRQGAGDKGDPFRYRIKENRKQGTESKTIDRTDSLDHSELNVAGWE